MSDDIAWGSDGVGERPVGGSRSMAVLTHMTALAALDRIPVPILAVDPHCVIVFANPAFCDMLGRPGADLAGTSIASLLRDPESVPGTCAELAGHAGSVLGFIHAENWRVLAKLSQSVQLPGGDAGGLFVFDDVTQLVWESWAVL